MASTSDIVHVVSTPSFMAFVSGAFEEVAPGRSVFVGVDVPVERLRLSGTVVGETVQRDDAGRDRLRELLATSRIAVFHNVTDRFVASALAEAPDSALRVWSGWGGDYYGGDLDALAGLVGSRTRRLVRRLRPRDYWLERLLELRHLAPILRAAARSADIFSAPIPEDLAVFTRRFRSFQGRYSQLNYGSIEDTFAVGPDAVVGNDILLGNSATPENNHLEVLELLARQDLGAARVHAPLAYGDSRYAAAVAQRGQELLGDRFVAITDPVPLDEYHQMLSRCSVSVMGHRRQQALGNVIRALWQGAHLVLDPRSPVTGYLSARGIRVEDLGTASVGELAASVPRAEQVASHRAVLEQYWGRPATLANIEALIALAD